MGRGRLRGHAAVLSTAPAHTFGGRHSSPTYADAGPGPGAYRPRLTGSSQHLKGVGVGFGTSQRLAPYGNRNPAPGDYNPSLALQRSSSPSCTFHGVAAQDHRVRNPAPGQYNAQRCTEADSLHASAPAINMGQLLAPPKSHERRPAPGEYSPYLTSSVAAMDKGLPVTLKFRHEAPVHKALVAPGPGEYPLRSSLGGPAHTIAGRLTPSGSRAREQLPGPADYDLQGSTLGVAGRA